MINKVVTLLLCFCIFLHFSAQEKVMYFDSNWKETTAKNAHYYRPVPLLKIGNVELIRDYYSKTKTLQMQGYYANGIEKNYVGEIFWFDSYGNNNSYDIYINKTKQKKLSYYFDDGKLWKTVEYGDSLKNGKTIEYKPDGHVLGESIYENGHLVSGITGELYIDNQYNRYNKETKSNEYVNLPNYKGKTRNYQKIYYWKSNLKTATEFTFRDNEIILKKDFDESGNLIQQIDSTSYFYNTDELKNGKYFYYRPKKSAFTEPPSFIEYQSYPFSDVKMSNISHLILYRGTLHFLEKHQEKNLYRETGYDFFEDNNAKFMRLKLDFSSGSAWKPLKDYQDDETQIIPASEIEAFSKEKIYDKLSKKKWKNKDLKAKPISEELFFASPNFMGKTLRSSTKTETDEKESALIYLNISLGKYIILRETGGYFIPKKSGDIIEIPNFILN